jgi:hypothetical protein
MQLLTVCLLSSIGVDEDVQFEEASRLESSLDSSHHNILQVRRCLLCLSGVTVFFLNWQVADWVVYSLVAVSTVRPVICLRTGY